MQGSVQGRLLYNDLVVLNDDEQREGIAIAWALGRGNFSLEMMRSWPFSPAIL